jgi:hypothetical protein
MSGFSIYRAAQVNRAQARATEAEGLFLKAPAIFEKRLEPITTAWPPA